MNPQEQPVSIQHLSLKLEIPKSTLRFWEREFKGVLVPLRTAGGQRRYTDEHVSIIRKIRKLRGKGLSLPDIFGDLMRDRRKKMNDLNNSNIDFLANRVAEVVRDEVYRFFEKEGKETVES